MRRWSDDVRVEVVNDAIAGILRGKTPEERVLIGGFSWRTAQMMMLAQVASRHPEWSSDEVARETARRLACGPA